MNATLRNILLFAGLLLLLACVWYFRNIVVYILIAGVLSIMGRPLVDLLCMIRIGRWSFPRSLGALITLLIIMGLFFFFFSIFVPLITSQINYFSTIDSDKVVQIIEGPILYVENIFRSLSRDLADNLSVKDYLAAKGLEFSSIKTALQVEVNKTK